MPVTTLKVKVTRLKNVILDLMVFEDMLSRSRVTWCELMGKWMKQWCPSLFHTKAGGLTSMSSCIFFLSFSLPWYIFGPTEPTEIVHLSKFSVCHWEVDWTIHEKM